MSKLQLIKSISLFWLLTILITVGACKDEEPPIPIPDCQDEGAMNYNPDAEAVDNELCTYPALQVNVNYKFGEEPFNLDSVYYVGDKNVPVKLSIFKFYISNITLERADGGNVKVDDSYSLLSPDFARYNIGKIEVGEYESLSFDVGVDETANQRFPSDYAIGHPLSDTGMHTGGDGYLFVRAVGAVDTDYDGLFSNEIKFELGTVDLFRTVKGDVKLDVDADVKDIDIEVDLGKLFEGVDLSVDYSVNIVKDKELSELIMDNFIKGIRF